MRRISIVLCSLIAGGHAVFAAPVQRSADSSGGGLAGTAKGALTVNGVRVPLAHVYAALEPNSFDNSKDDIVIVFTDRPIPAGILASHTLGGLNSAPSAAGIEHFLRIELSNADEQERQSSRAILGTWIVGHRTIAHRALNGKSLQVSPDPVARMADAAISTARVRGRVHSDGPQTFPHDDEHQFDVAFDVAVAPRKPAAPPPASATPALDPAKTSSLPAGGGDPGKAYLAYNAALRSGDFAALERLDLSLSKVSAKEKALIRDMLPNIAGLLPADVRVTGGRSDGRTAVLDLEAEGGAKKGGAELHLTGGAWMVFRDWWQ